MLIAPAYAKINLSLEVVGRRPDGYHELVSVMQTVSLHDELRIVPGEALTFSCSESELNTRDNLVVKAAEMLRRERDSMGGADIRLTKHIPAAGGLGGGSSDAATTLVSLNRMWAAGASYEELSSLAARLGSDVPFFLIGGTALVEGRGERVSPLVDPPVRWFVLAKPIVGLATASVFSALSDEDFSDGTETRRLAESVAQGGAVSFGPNGLQAAACRICPEAAHCLDELEQLAPGRAIVSGSGPTSVAWFDAPDKAEAVTGVMIDRGFWATRVRSLRRGEMFT